MIKKKQNKVMDVDLEGELRVEMLQQEKRAAALCQDLGKNATTLLIKLL